MSSKKPLLVGTVVSLVRCQVVTVKLITMHYNFRNKSARTVPQNIQSIFDVKFSPNEELSRLLVIECSWCFRY